jgi:hypothetical protein
LALPWVKCQSSDVPDIAESQYQVTGTERTLSYWPQRVTIDDGTEIVHESLGGSLSSAWAGDLGDRYVEVVHVGDGPNGGELVLVVPDLDVVALGDLYARSPDGATPSWAEAVDLTLGLTTISTNILSSSGPVTRDELEAFHQRLLGVLHG